MTLTEGQLVRVDGCRGLFRAVQKAPGEHCWWFLPCDKGGRWNQREGWRAFRVDRCREVKK